MGERLWNDANAGSRTYPLCQRCYDSHYTNCERCGELIDCENAYYLGDGEDYPYCENCYHILKNQVIHNYDYRPETIFYGDEATILGVELEIDKGGEIGSNAEQILCRWKPGSMIFTTASMMAVWMMGLKSSAIRQRWNII